MRSVARKLRVKVKCGDIGDRSDEWLRGFQGKK